MRTTLKSALLASTLLLVAACGGAGSADDHNDADVTFAQEMIPHHRQAVEMAQLAESRAESPDVKSLAADIEAAQDPEIETMTGWLESWDEEVPEDMSGMDHGSMHGDMPGMMSEDEMADLADSSGAEFDQMFLTMMVEHHEGAVDMAKAEQSDGSYPDAVELAKDIEATQTAEIETMQGLLEQS